MRKQYWLLLFILLSSLLTLKQAKAKQIERCILLEPEIRRAHFYYFGLNFPFWYSVAQAKQESKCRHDIISTDGNKSEGFSQITYSLWKNKLRKAGIPEITSIPNHAKAQAFINKYYYNRIICKRLWVMYQAYNGGLLINKELQTAGCDWSKAYKSCRRKDICVKPIEGGRCKQYRNACDINYEYSVLIYKFGQKYKKGTDYFPFW
jgi:hypothetical protein